MLGMPCGREVTWSLFKVAIARSGHWSLVDRNLGKRSHF
jgi:hypothetical protein